MQILFQILTKQRAKGPILLHGTAGALNGRKLNPAGIFFEPIDAFQCVFKV
jgi:hypothetical protein